MCLRPRSPHDSTGGATERSPGHGVPPATFGNAVALVGTGATAYREALPDRLTGARSTSRPISSATIPWAAGSSAGWPRGRPRAWRSGC